MDVDDKRVARVTARSRIGRLGHSAIERLHRDTRRSVVGAALLNAFAAINALGADERVRLTGVLILVATAVNAVLLQLSPSMVRPVAPTLVSMEIAAAGLLLIVLATPIARAWTSSRVRRLLFGAHQSHSNAGDPT